MIEKKTKGAFYYNLKHTKDEEKTTIFLGGGSMLECIPLITSNLDLKLMAMDSYRDKSFCNAEIPQKIPRITRYLRCDMTLVSYHSTDDVHTVNPRHFYVLLSGW